MITSMTALAATTSGKIVLSSLAAATAFGGASAAGFVNINSADAAAEFFVGADASTNDEIRVNAQAAGSFAFVVEDDQLRLRDISSEAGWNGRLTADTDTALIVSFTNENAADREITAELRLIASAESDDGVGGEIDIVVLIKLTDEDGQSSIVRVDAQGSAIADGDVETDIFADATITATDGENLDVDADVFAATNVETDDVDTQAGVSAATTVQTNATDINAGATADATAATDDADVDVHAAADATVATDDADVDADVFAATTVQTNDTDVNAGATADATAATGDTDIDVDADIDATVATNTADAAVEALVQADDGNVNAGANLVADGADVDADAGLDLGLNIDLDDDAALDLGLGGGLGLN